MSQNNSTTQPTKVNVSYESYEDATSITRNRWDPLHCDDWDAENPSIMCLSRIKSDVSHFLRDPPSGIFIVPDESNMTKIHALIVGPHNTPYEGGFFYFIIRCPPDYPLQPPRCRLMTTGNGTVRFNPNLYRSGKVCLSIIGTWTGPKWSPAQNLSSLLLSIQSLMSENPYHNEPGYESERHEGESKTFNKIIQHETIRVAVCDMLESNPPCFPQFREHLAEHFLQFYDYYVKTCQENLHETHKPMLDPFNERRGNFNYLSLLARLKKLQDTSTNKESKQSVSKARPYVRSIPSSTDVLDSQLLDTNDVMNYDDIFNNDVDDFNEDDDDDDTEA